MKVRIIARLAEEMRETRDQFEATKNRDVRQDLRLHYVRLWNAAAFLQHGHDMSLYTGD